MHEYIIGLMVLALLYTPGYFIGKNLIKLGKDISKNYRWIYVGFVWAIFMGPLPVELLGPPIPFYLWWVYIFGINTTTYTLTSLLEYSLYSGSSFLVYVVGIYTACKAFPANANMRRYRSTIRGRPNI
jgi:hypothetical protein